MIELPYLCSLARFKRRVREITRRAKGVSIDATMEELAPYMRGWRSSFGFCETPRVLASLTSWVRARLRVALWRQWKTIRRRRAALLARGVRPKLARNTAGSSRGPWYLAHAKALPVALPTAYFTSLGLRIWRMRASVTISNRRVRPVRTVVWQGSAGNRCPYADLTDLSNARNTLPNFTFEENARPINH